MKVLLVQSYLGQCDSFPVYPLGLAYIGTSLNHKGHEVEIFDPNVSTHPYDDLQKRVVSFSPDIVGISLRNIDNQHRVAPFYHYQYFQHTLKTIKESSPDVKIIVGGAGFSMFAEKIMERNPSIDFGIYLEGEENVPELLDNLNNPESVSGIYFRKNGKVTFSGFRPLPDFRNDPMPRRNFLDITPYLSHLESLGIQTVRGCPLKCTYCNYPQLNGNRVRARDAKSVCDEIEYLIKQYHINQFMFADGVFNAPLRHSEEICEEIIKRGLKVKWSAWMELKHIPKSFLLLAMKAGCVGITFSPDGISQNALDGLRKGLKERDIKDSFVLFTKDEDVKSLNVTYGMFINPPGETFLGLIKTIIFFIKGKLLLAGRGGTFINWIRLEPETKVFLEAIGKGEIPRNLDLLPDNQKELKKLFYSKSPLCHLDFLIITMLKSLNIFKLLLLKSGLKKTRRLERKG